MRAAFYGQGEEIAGLQGCVPIQTVEPADLLVLDIGRVAQHDIESPPRYHLRKGQRPIKGVPCLYRRLLPAFFLMLVIEGTGQAVPHADMLSHFACWIGQPQPWS